MSDLPRDFINKGSHSECCNAPMYDEQNMCSACKEYCMSNEAKEQMLEVGREYAAAKAARAATGTRVLDDEDEDECPHDETDHYICLECGKDTLDDAIAAAEFRADCLEDR